MPLCGANAVRVGVSVVTGCSRVLAPVVWLCVAPLLHSSPADIVFYDLSAAVGKKEDFGVANNRNLQTSKNARMDEFYTQIPDIEKEMGEENT